MAKKQKIEKSITKPLLRQINDHAGGGFILFNFDSEGLPQVHSNFVDHPHALGLQYYIKNWSEAIEGVTIAAMSQSVLGPEDDEIQGEDEGPTEEI